MTVSVGDKLSIKCGDAIVIIKMSVEAKKLDEKASGDVTIKGSRVKVN